MPIKRDFDALEWRCDQASTILEEIEEPLLAWAAHKEKLLAPWESLKRKHRELCERFPEEWHGGVSAQLLAGGVLTIRERARRFLKAIREELRAEESALLEHFARNPWFYCLFRILKHEQGEFFSILDLDTEEEHLLRSGAVRSLERTGAQLFLGLMFDDAACLQTFGPMHYYRGFQPYDFQYFARLLDPTRLHSEGLSAVIASSPGSFLLLDGWTEIPPVAHGKELVEVCSAEFPLAGFEPASYRGRLEIEAVEGLVRCRLKGERSPLRLAAAYYDAAAGRLAVQASTFGLYGKLRDLLGPEVPVPARPSWRATITMSLAAREVLGKQDPASPYTLRFEEQEFPEAARELEKIVKSQDEALEIEIEGGLEGYTPPPPAVRAAFRLSPWDHGLFSFLDSPRVRRLYAELLPALRERREASTRIKDAVGPPPEELEELPGWLEDLYDETQEQDDFTLLNTAFDLLSHRGERAEPVRDYAVETLRLFWQVLLPGREAEHIERFHGRFARFVHDVLFSGGLVDIDPPVNRLEARRAAFSIRPSLFFRGWVRLREPRGGAGAASP